MIPFIRIVIILIILLVTMPGVNLARAPIAWNPTDFEKKNYTKTLIHIDSEDKISPLKLYSSRNEYTHFKFSLTATKHHNVSFDLKGGDRQFKSGIFRIIHAPPGNTKFAADVLRPITGQINISPGTTDFWVSFYTPKESKPGNYDCQFFINGDFKAISIPMRIRIWKFVIEDDLPIVIKSNLIVNQEQLARYNVKTLGQYKEIVQSYLVFLRKYKINALAGGYPHPHFARIKGMTFEEQLKEYQENLHYLLNQLGYKIFSIKRVPGLTRAHLDSERFSQEAQNFYPRFMGFLKQKGWGNRVEIVCFDEPGLDFMPVLKRANEFIRKTAPGLPIVVHSEPTPRLFGLIDIWTAYACRINWENLAAARQRGDQIRLYYNPLHGLDYPPVYQRVLGWLLFQNEFDGYYFWGGNYWKDDPWTTPSGHRGCWFYPDPDTGLPWPALRLEAVRDGLQDYQYFVKFFSAYRQGKISQRDYDAVTRALHLVTKDFTDLQVMRTKAISMDLMETTHQRMGNALDRVM